MNSKSSRNILIGVAVLVLLVGGGVLLLTQSESAQEKVLPQLEDIRKLSVVISYDTAHISAEVGIKNPLPNDITIDSLAYTLVHETDTVGKGHRTPETKLVAGETTYFQVKLGADFDLLQEKIKALQGTDSTEIDLGLELFFDMPLVGRQSVAINKTQQVNVPKLPVVTVESMKVVDFGLGDGIELEMMLQFQNENLKDITVSNLQYSVQADDFLKAEEKLEKTYVIKANQTSTHALPLHLSLKEAITAKAKEKFGDKTWQVTVKGSATVSTADEMLDRVALTFYQQKTIDASEAGTKKGKDKNKDNDKKKEEKKDDEEDKGFLKKVKEKVL